MKIQEQVALAPLTTIKVGGPARYFVEAETTTDIREAIAFARSRKLPFFVLGGGSNLVVADGGFDGVVVKVGLRGIREIGPRQPEAGRYGAPDGTVVLSVGAGEDWDNVVARAVERDCAGLECLSGIPGTVGATPVQNVGAYGQEVSETIVSVKALEIESGRECDFTNAECGFAYRKSRFNTVDRERYVILGVTFALTQGGAPKIAYGDLKKCFEANAKPSLADVRAAVLTVRRGKGMVVAEDDPDSRSAGSFFKNPVLSEEQFCDLERRASARGLAIPSYPALASQHKVSAAWLIEQAGFPRGYAKGPVGISSKHTLAIVNRGGAKAADVLALKDEVQRGVKKQFGIELQPEPVFLGELYRETSVHDYVVLMRAYLDGEIDVRRYQKEFFQLSKTRVNISDEKASEIIQRAYGDADDFDDEIKLPYTIGEKQLRDRVRQSLNALSSLGYSSEEK